MLQNQPFSPIKVTASYLYDGFALAEKTLREWVGQRCCQTHLNDQLDRGNAMMTRRIAVDRNLPAERAGSNLR